MAHDLSNRDFELGPVRVRPGRLLFEFDGAEQRVEPRVMEILVFLAEHGDEPVSRERLRDELWDAYVSDDAIHRGVWKLRQALGEHAELVETIPKRGYRLTASPVPVSTEPTDDSRGPGHAGRREPATVVRFAGAAITAVLVAFALWLGLRDATLPAAAPGDGGVDFSPFSSMSGYESQPEIDPDGEVVVFANFPKEGEDAFQWDLWERPLDGSPARRLTATPEHEMSSAISPDGGRLAFARFAGEECAIVLRDRTTGEEADAGIDCGASRGPADCCPAVGWLGDARLLVSRRTSADAPKRIYELEIGSGAMRMLTDPPAQSDGDVDFAVSHDRTRVAIVRRRTPEVGDLHLLDVATGELRRLTSTGYGVSGLGWSSRDDRILFGWNRTGRASLWDVSPSGGTPRPLRTVGMNASNPAAATDALVYEEWTSEINLVRLDLRNGTAARPVPSARWDWRGSMAPDGERLAFVTNREGGEQLWIATRGEAPRRLADLQSPLASAPAWSPDGQQVAVSVVSATGLDIALIDAVAGSTRWLVADASDDREPVFTADGTSVLFASNRSGSWEIHSIELSTGVARRWTRDGGVAARPSRAGGIWFLRPGTPGLWKQDSPEEAPTLADDTFRPSAPADWVVIPGDTEAAEVVYFTRWDEQSTGWLARLEPGGATRDLVRLEDPAGIAELHTGGGLWVSPDGHEALISSVDLSHSDLWLRR